LPRRQWPPICRYLAIAKVQTIRRKFTRTSTGLRRLSLSRSRLPSFPRPSWFAGLSLLRRRQWCLMNIRSMRHRACMGHLLCMRMPVRLGVVDGAMDVTSAAVGKILAYVGNRRGYCFSSMRARRCPLWAKAYIGSFNIYSITSSAATSSPGGTDSPIALAARTLTDV
jgi:hypothetical protein